MYQIKPQIYESCFYEFFPPILRNIHHDFFSQLKRKILWNKNQDSSSQSNKIYKDPVKGKSPEVPFHGITSQYSYFEVIWILAPIQQEAKHDQEKLSAEQK